MEERNDFSPRATLVLRRVAELGGEHGVIDTGSLLVALCEQQDGSVAQALHENGVTAERASIGVGALRGGPVKPRKGKTRRTPVFERAMTSSRSFAGDHRSVTSADLLAGLLDESEAIAARVLQAMGVSAPRLLGALPQGFAAREADDQPVTVAVHAVAEIEFAAAPAVVWSSVSASEFLLVSASTRVVGRYRSAENRDLVELETIEADSQTVQFFEWFEDEPGSRGRWFACDNAVRRLRWVSVEALPSASGTVLRLSQEVDVAGVEPLDQPQKVEEETQALQRAIERVALSLARSEQSTEGPAA